MPYQWNQQHGNNGQHNDPNLSYGPQSFHTQIGGEMQRLPVHFPVELGPGRAGVPGSVHHLVPTPPFQGVVPYQQPHPPPHPSPTYHTSTLQHQPQYYSPQQQAAAYHAQATQLYGTGYSNINYPLHSHAQPVVTPQHFHPSPLPSHTPSGQFGLPSTFSKSHVQDPQLSPYMGYGQARNPGFPPQHKPPVISPTQAPQPAAPQQSLQNPVAQFDSPTLDSGQRLPNGSFATPIMSKQHMPQQPSGGTPIQQPPSKSVTKHHSHSTKRRRSNEGHTSPVIKQEPKQSQPKQQAREDIDTSLHSLGAAETQPSKTPSTQPPQHKKQPHQPTVNYQTVLHGLADEYLAAAYQMDMTTATAEDVTQYQSLVAMAMRCLQSSLTNYRETDPRKEARVRLHLATLIAEETENAEEAENTLAKGIALCERSRLPDIKYTMQYILIQQEFRTSPKRAFKTIGKVIQEVQTLRIFNWSYAFILLYVSLAMQTSISSHTVTLIHLLSVASPLADSRKETAVAVMVNCLQALVHLASSTAGAAKSAQSALAAARAHQHSPAWQQMPEVHVLLNCIDLACALLVAIPEQIAEKMQLMQESLDSMPKSSKSSKTGSLVVQLGASANVDLDLDTRGLMRRDDSGHATIELQWLSRNDVFVLGFVLSSIASVYANSSNSVKTLEFLEEGKKMMVAPKERLNHSPLSRVAQERMHAALSIAVGMQEVFAHACLFEWPKAQQCLSALKEELALSGVQLDEYTEVLLIYQEALCKHGHGDLDGALELYACAKLKYDRSCRNTFLKDLQSLAALNRILIIRPRSIAQAGVANDLLRSIEPHCTGNPNKSIRAAWHAATATADDPKSAIVKTKKHLQLSIQAAKEAKNSQMLCIVMNVMSSLFFTNIVGVQAEKSVRAGRHLAKSGQGNLWLAVADGMYSDNAMRSGRTMEAERAAQEAREAVMSLPVLVREGVTKQKSNWW